MAPSSIERLLEMDSSNHTYKYLVLSCPSSFSVGYVATFQLSDAGNDSTTILWSYEASPIAELQEDSFRAAVLSVYESCIVDLKKALSIE